METVGELINQSIIDSFCRKSGDGSWRVMCRSYSHDRYKTITEGPARLVTTSPGAITLGEKYTEGGGDSRCDERWETIYRHVEIVSPMVGMVGFVAYATNRHSTGCQYSGGDYVVPLVGEVPILDFGTSYACWAERMEIEAYDYLDHLATDKKVRRSLRFAVGMAHSFAQHEERRKAWISVLRTLGVRDVSRIIGSIRTATCKAALRLGWKPSVARPTYWAGLPVGVVEVSL